MRRLGEFFFVVPGLVLTLAIVPASSHAVSIPLSAVMDCAQANAGAGTCGAGGTGTGTMTGTFDTVTNLFSWSVSWSGLSGSPSAQHFHGPALPNQNAGVQVNIGVGANPAVGNQVLTTTQGQQLLQELWYVNLHTSTFPGGEIRGQVVPEPSSLLLMGGALGVLAALRRRTAA